MLSHRLTRMGGLLPAIHDGVEWRFLGRIKTDLPKNPIARFSDYLVANSIPVLDLSTLAPYDRYQSNIPILDQNSMGACTAHSHCTFIMKARDTAGETYIALSPTSLYSQINGGTDQGSDPADAITALENTGICTLADVPDTFVLWNAISDAAKTTAKRFRISSLAVYKCDNFAELVTADYLGFATTLTINVSNNWGPDSNGVVSFARGFANHSVSGGEAFKLIGGVPSYRFRNSWTNTWGISGCAWCQSPHIDQQQGVELYCCKWVLSDPNDPLNPPLS